jgi:hypothetical protein
MQSDNNSIMERFLFLDDIRHPNDVYTYTQQTIFLHKNWEIVRNYMEFVQWITINGLPDFISFDHDLADMEYTSPPHLLIITNQKNGKRHRYILKKQVMNVLYG